MKKANHIVPFLLCIIPLLTTPCWAWQGKVVGVSDGDTITVMHDGKGEKIRLYGVDTPEKAQDFGQKAKQFSSDLVFGKTVDVRRMDTDRYGRTVGVVTVDGKTLNEELIKAGMAWVYTEYCKESFCSQWQKFQDEAKNKKIGLWSMPNSIRPSEFRRNGRSGGGSEQRSTQQTSPHPPPQSQGSVVYHGNVSSKVFHKHECPQYNCKNCTAQFKTREEAISAGFKPCGICKP